MTSTKKKDSMAPFTNATNDGKAGGTTYSNQPAVLVGATTYIFPWIATARTAVQYNGNPGDKQNQATRTSNVCFMRGLKERIQVQTNDGTPWQWRRICFTMKGYRLINNDQGGFRLAINTTSGIARVVNSWAGTAIGSALVDLIFDGKNGQDWTSPFAAKVDRDLISVKYDKTRIIQSGNANGVMRNYNIWHAMNHNLNYADEEAGDTETYSQFSVEGKQGMGDYYVIDIIAAGSASTSANQMTFDPRSTLYWHEK